MPLKYNLTFALIQFWSAWDAGNDCSYWLRDLNNECKIAVLELGFNPLGPSVCLD